jgi:hypothetical protein
MCKYKMTEAGAVELIRLSLALKDIAKLHKGRGSSDEPVICEECNKEWPCATLITLKDTHVEI